jgi:glycosidase
MKNAIINYVKYAQLDDLVEVLSFISDQYPRNVQNNLMNILDSHDTVRILSAFGNNNYTLTSTSRDPYDLSPLQREKGKNLVKQATILQYTVMGIPTVFYGDEVAVEGMKDPYSRVCYPWGNEDTDMLEWYRSLGRLRQNPVFDGGDFRFLNTKDKVIAYERVKGDDAVVVVLNKSKVKYYINIEGDFVEHITGDTYSNVHSVCIEPEKYMILVKQVKKKTTKSSK